MHKVELEFKRIQTYLFASPRLRAMLGANASLGGTIRVKLSQIAKRCGATADPKTLEAMPKADKDDPLQQAQIHTDNAPIADDPAGLYENYGVLVRDGGHFIATFPGFEQARSFIKQATTCISEELPGILLEARLKGERQGISQLGESLYQHPGFQVSHFLGNRPAAARGAKGAFISAEEAQLEERGKNFRKQPSDLIGLLEQKRLVPCAEEPPQSLSDVVGNDYLALIHADGNSIGKRYQEWRKRCSYPEQSLEAEAHGERFFHSMRVAVRRALIQALNQVFEHAPQRYQLLMLGGDDLLLACAASYALPFVHAYAAALENITLCDDKPLSIGVGVAIAKETFPFHRLHATAEALADSAKQRYRVDPSLGSVVDWHVTTNAWIEDPIAERRIDSLAGNAVLSGKPYPVLGKRSLKTLLDQSKRIEKEPQVARSQLRNLVEVMRHGPNLAELTWLEMPNQMRSILQDALTSFDQSALFSPLEGNLRISILPDLVELYEINLKAQQSTNIREGVSVT